MLLATAARVWAAARLPFEQDELYTMDEATNLFHTRLLPGIQARPVFFLVEHLFVKYGYDNALALRALPLVFGAAGMIAIWFLAKSVLGRTGGAVAVALVAISPWHMYASAFARYYSLIFLLATLGYWLIPRAYDSDRPRDYLYALLPLLLGAWTHPSFVFPMAGAALAITLADREGHIRWKWPTRNAWTYLWGPLVLVSLAGLVAIRLLRPATNVANGGDRGLLAALRLVPAMVDWTTLVVAAAGIIGAIAMLGSPTRRRFALMALLGVMASVLALVALSFVTAIYADYGMAALPLVLVSAAGLVQWLADMAPERSQPRVAWAVATLLVAGALPSALSYLSDGTRFDYRGAFARIERDAPSTPVLTWPIALQRYYAPRLHGIELPGAAPALDSALARAGDLWAVISVKRYGIVADDRGVVAHWLDANCRPVEQFQRPRLDYRMYRVDLWRCTRRQ